LRKWCSVIKLSQPGRINAVQRSVHGVTLTMNPSSAGRSGIVKSASGLGRQALVFDDDEVVRLLRAAVEQEGGQKAFASRHGLDRAYVNMVLNGRAGIRDALAKALGLRKVYAAE